ncbi:hypothetical protein ZIOFF_065309 [Zingiber officinale]|uniref:Uncharacterized protein n=1 Tax=Zingiber officinale TaxID=94328 RepID=A0A8J5EX60_ZINOF|nr:hypothetical protein ZIOFF_065309 [Zingiber officinale]
MRGEQIKKGQEDIPKQRLGFMTALDRKKTKRVAIGKYLRGWDECSVLLACTSGSGDDPIRLPKVGVAAASPAIFRERRPRAQKALEDGHDEEHGDENGGGHEPKRDGDGVIASSVREQQEEQPLEELGNQVRALALDIGGRVVGGGEVVVLGFSSSLEDEQDIGKSLNRAVNAAIVLDAGTFAITKLFTIDSDYWHTLYEILRYAPLHNWVAYEQSLKTHPVLAKMLISGIVYSLGDWIAQCYEGKPLFEFDRARMFRSGLVGFSLHGSLSHYYYHFCEALFPFQDWWVVPAKVVFDQTAWSALWNSIYYAGWKLWPFAQLITYGVFPVEQRLLWVDCVELVWPPDSTTPAIERGREERGGLVVSAIGIDGEWHRRQLALEINERGGGSVMKAVLSPFDGSGNMRRRRGAATDVG